MVRNQINVRYASDDQLLSVADGLVDADYVFEMTTANVYVLELDNGLENMYLRPNDLPVWKDVVRKELERRGRLETAPHEAVGG